MLEDLLVVKCIFILRDKSFEEVCSDDLIALELGALCEYTRSALIDLNQFEGKCLAYDHDISIFV